MPMGKPHVYRFNKVGNKMELSYDLRVSLNPNTWLADQVNAISDLHYAVKNGENVLGHNHVA